MSSKYPRNDGPDRTPRRADPTDENAARRATAGDPVDPRDTGGDNPNPRPTLKSFGDVVKILVAVALWWTTTDASIALREAAKYVDLGKTVSLLHLDPGSVANIVLWGALLGLAHGLILGIKALVFIWVGPTFFEYLYPVFVAASRISARVVSDVRRGWTDRGLPTLPAAPANAVIDPPADTDRNPGPRPPRPDAEPPARRPDGEPPAVPKEGPEAGKTGEDKGTKDNPEPPQK